VSGTWAMVWPHGLVVAMLGYLLGSVSGSLVLGRLQSVDIRAMGSGNAGGTNALRTQGWPFALGVVAIDIGKGALAAGVAPFIVTLVFGATTAWLTLATIAGLAAILGHIWPLYFGFRGGKGAGTAVGAVAVIAPSCIGPMFLVWLVTVLVTGYVGLATIFAGVVLIPTVWWLGPHPLPPALAGFAIAVAVVIVLTHRGNIQRLIEGNENRFDTQKLWRRRDRSS